MKTAVLINNHNRAAWLPACIDSVLAQTPAADEIVVYDDASTDDSLAILHRYEPRVFVIPGPRIADQPACVHQGIAIYEAFRRSTADIVLLLDSDDVFTPGKIARYLVAFSQRPGPTLVQAPMHWIDAEGRRLPRYPEPFKHTHNPLATAYARHDPDLFYPTSALAFSREFLAHALPIDWSDGIKLWSDSRLCLAALLHGQIVTLPEEWGGWRHHTTSASARQSKARTYQLCQTVRRTRIFNQLTRQAGRPPIALWRNRRFYLQLSRLLLPSSVFHAGRRIFTTAPTAQTSSVE